DATVCDEVLRSIHARRHACECLQSLPREIERGAAAVILAEEALSEADLPILRDVLSAQPPWSDLPIVVITEDRADGSAASESLTTLGNVVLLARPIRINTFISTLRSALRARQRQYATRQNL